MEEWRQIQSDILNTVSQHRSWPVTYTLTLVHVNTVTICNERWVRLTNHCQADRQSSEEHDSSLFLNIIPVGDEPCNLSCVSINSYPLNCLEPIGTNNEWKNLTPDLASDLGRSVWTDLAVVAVVFSVLPRREDDFPCRDQLDPQFHHCAPLSVFTPSSFLLKCVVWFGAGWSWVRWKILQLSKSVEKNIPSDGWKSKICVYYKTLCCVFSFKWKLLTDREDWLPGTMIKSGKQRLEIFKHWRRDLEPGCYLLQCGESQWGQLPRAAARGCCSSSWGIMGRIWSSACPDIDVTWQRICVFCLTAGKHACGRQKCAYSQGGVCTHICVSRIFISCCFFELNWFCFWIPEDNKWVIQVSGSHMFSTTQHVLNVLDWTPANYSVIISNTKVDIKV